MRQTLHLRIALLLAVVLASAACAADPTATQTAVACEAPCSAGEYVIGPGDVLQIAVWKDENLDRTVPVRPDGMISFPLLNDIRAAGLTPMQLRTALMEKLKEYLSAPEVSVVVREVHSFAVSVLGQVKNPGRYELKSEVTVLDVLAEAGGFTDFASPSKIAILRGEGSARKRIAFDYNEAISKSGGQENIELLPGDIVLVP